MEHQEIAQMIPLLAFFILIPIFIVIACLPVIAFWKICSKAGFAGALGLLMLVPIANLILPLYIAFARWPALEMKSKETQ